MNQKSSDQEQLEARHAERERLLDIIKRLEEIELPQQESALKETIGQTQQVQAEISERQIDLERLEQDISAKKASIKELEEKKSLLGKEHQGVATEQKRLNKALTQLRAEIREKEVQRDELNKKPVQLESEINESNQTLTEARKAVELLKKEIAKQEAYYEDLVKEARPIEEQLKVKTSEKQKLLDMVKHLKAVDQSHHELRIKEITDKVSRRQALNQGLVKEIAALDTQIQAKTEEKQKTLDTVKHLEEITFPSHKTEVKKITEESERLQTETQERQGVLARTEQELSEKKDKMRELQRKNTLLNNEHHKAKSNQKRLDRTSTRLEGVINQKRAQYDELIKKMVVLELDTSTEVQELDKTKRPLELLTDKISEQKDILGSITQLYTKEKREFGRPFMAQRWQAVFWLCLILFMLGSLGLLLWMVFS